MTQMNRDSRRSHAFAAGASLLWCVCCLGVLGAALTARSAVETVASSGAANPDQPAEGTPGWLVTFKSPAKGGKAVPDTIAVSPVAAFSLQPGQGLNPSVAAAGLNAVYSTRMKFTAPATIRFGAEVEGGTLSISVSGAALGSPAGRKIDGSAVTPGGAVNPVFTDWLTIKPGELNLRFEFSRAGDAPARLRSIWEQQGKGTAGFVAEPIPPSAVLLPTGSDSAAESARSAFHGRVLLGELGCTHCHTPVTSSAIIDRPAPLMADIGARVSPTWLAAWIRDPQNVKPGCGMPDLFTDSKADLDDADAIVQFLASLGGPIQPEPIANEPAVIESGRKVFLHAGCIACHGDLSANSKPPVPFGNLAGKWKPSALSAFLRDPLATHPAGRMPSFDLSQGESDLVATYLLSAWGGSSAAASAPDATRVDGGRKAFAARGCADCHHSAVPEGPSHVVSTLQARPLPTLRPGKGCLDPADTQSPRYTLSDTDRADLSAALQQAKTWTGAPCPADLAAVTVSGLGCVNCHQWNGVGGVPDDLAPQFDVMNDADLGADGNLPPRLTGVGGKLATGWLRQVLLESGRARPYLSARMPQFGAAQVGEMAERLAAFDGVWPDKDRPEPTATPELTDAGRRLVGSQGLNCISCHAFGDAPLAGTPGPNIVAFAERLRYDWWRRYILAPERFKPGTKMNNFFAEGVSTNRDILGGDPGKQADALWTYFSLGEFAPAPDGLPTVGGMEVRVGDRPVILRAFLKSAGSRGIAIGFPSGTHFAFDAESCRLAEVWHGKFLDASGAWAGRGGTILKGQGPDLWSPPAGPAIVAGPRPETWPTEAGREAGYHFKGYRIDKDGVPVFQYLLDSKGGPIHVSERFEPAKGAGGGLRRTFTVDAGAELWINAGKGSATAATDPPNSTELESVSGPGGETWMHVKGGGLSSQGQPVVVVVEVRP